MITLSPRAIEAAADAVLENCDEAVEEIATAAITAYLAAREAEGFVEVSREPTPHQIAAALPTDCRASVDEAAKKIGAAAVMQLLGGRSISTEGELVLQAAYLVQDYRAMLTAAQNGGEDAGK